MQGIKQILELLIEKAKKLHLNKGDIDSVIDLFKHHEFGLALDTLATQLYDYNIGIDQETYDLVRDASIKMDLPIDNYIFMKELIKNC